MADELWARLLGEAWAALGGAEPATELQVTGARGSLPSHVPVEDTAIACAGAALLAAADHGTGYLCAAAVLRGLADQAVAGGTQVRELSLARTAQWLLGSPTAGLTPASGGRAGGDADWLTTLGSPEGTVTVVRPLGQLDGRELTWPAPLTRYGGDPPAWR